VGTSLAAPHVGSGTGAEPGVRTGDASLAARRRRRLVGLGLLCVGLLVAAAASLAGRRPVAAHADVWSALVDPVGAGADPRVAEAEVIVRELRVPRTALAIVVGLALGAAGALMQGHTRNPLADPGLLGVSAGAGLAVVLAVTLLGTSSVLGTVWPAFAGALVASALVLRLGASDRQDSRAAAAATRSSVAVSATLTWRAPVGP
jgi:iron complex transport system permease protein